MNARLTFILCERILFEINISPLLFFHILSLLFIQRTYDKKEESLVKYSDVVACESSFQCFFFARVLMAGAHDEHGNL